MSMFHEEKYYLRKFHRRILKLCKQVLIANTDKKIVLKLAILMLFPSKRIIKCRKIGKYQQPLVTKNVLQSKCVSKQLQ